MSADVASAQRVTLKPAPEKTSVEKVATPEKETKKAEAAPKKESAKKPTTRKTSTTAKPNADSGILTPPPTSPLEPRTPQELDAKYPVVPDALRMTLEELIPTKELRNVRVLKAMARIPRAEFVTKEFREYAYQDAALPIGDGQTISAPFIVAYMTETLDPQPTDRVLEIGTGSGYQAAVLSCLVSEVYSIEIVKNLGRRAAETLKKLEYDNVFVRVGDGYQGWPEAAPFDKIIVTCSPEDVPQPLLDQLKEGGKLIIPVGERYQQYFVLCEKKDGKIERKELIPICFVPMTGEAEEKRVDLPDPAKPSVVGGGFEEIVRSALVASRENGENSEDKTTAQKRETKSDDSADKKDEKKSNELAIELPPRLPTPVGWYATRNVYVAERDDAPEGSRVCVCDNASVREEHRKKDRNEARFAAATLPENRRELSGDFANLKERQREREMYCHLRQFVPVDGTKVKKIVLTGQARALDLQATEGRQTVPLARIVFFDRNRKPIADEILWAASAGTFDWREMSEEIAVPRRATEASLQIGILEGVGTVELDAIELKDKFEKPERGNRRRD
ncbi:MAG: protein-L-isoaspartate(D-aspartate) O-methyltransferase [Thermoguttaceae bacterium]|nr:protein-L-isoaspartate(D-aspartate) O-methyltransferase [Thermoguttaceae bacterium]MBQ7111158.1 protein-L-isoaspartate(D-aspartate) O-methyltransferase [Thermoguttaceae bacterium]